MPMSGHFPFSLFKKWAICWSLRNLAHPSLSVEPSVITETDSVTLHCQPPYFTSDSLCYFILNGVVQSSSTCVQTVRGSDLLKDQSPPAQVKVQCFYTINGKWTNSLYSNGQTVTIHNLAHPSLSVEPSVITETDSVTLHCQPPYFTSDSLCYFILNGVVQSSSTCVQTVRGSDLLKDQSPPAQVKVQCFYTINGKWTNSLYSNGQTVTIHNLAHPSLSVEPSVITETDSVTLHCQPPYFTSDSLCYFILNGVVQSSSTCVQTVRGSDLLKDQSPPAQVKVQCFYTINGKWTNSLYSNGQTVTIHNLTRPSLSVEPSVIIEIDSVTLHCQPPDFASESLCSFILNGVIQSSSPCVQTVRGSDLLKDQSPPAQVKVQCFYTINGKWTNSPHSSEQTVIIQKQ
ncbi:uncharacterized protein LOC129456867 [Periophthalmus magnuspinnatus]|uniref:uncharacterized protein LOC129456867 n=1 Tax=Periophthalmus magnuspinnatus TaxID=409849 RepID=UPI0024367FFE|nr:uncharacterized protein LOC129456867 [Periophthalmus magnuspinnatus]